MRYFGFRTFMAAAFRIGLAAAPLPVQALSLQAVDFESPAYVSEKTFAGVDEWAQAVDVIAPSAENFKVQDGGAANGKWAHILTAGTTTLYRPFPALSGIL